MTEPVERRASSVSEEVQGRTLVLTNLEKVLWCETGFTKRDLIDYYRTIAPVLLPHLAGRPLTLKRYPDGIDDMYWFQTRCPNPPAWLSTFRVTSASDPETAFDYCVVDDLPSLVWVANLAAVELHPFLWRIERPAQPSFVVFDLDPGPPATIVECCRVAVWLRDRLDELELRSHPKTSGAKGLHVYVPLNLPHDQETVKNFARAVAASVCETHGEQVVDRPRRAVRAGKVLIDWSQNNVTRSTVAPYSLRAMPLPTVSTPLTWEEVERGRDGGPARLIFTPEDVFARVGALGDLFAPVLDVDQRLPSS